MQLSPLEPLLPKGVAQANCRDFDMPAVDDWRDAWFDYMDFDRPIRESEYGYIRDF